MKPAVFLDRDGVINQDPPHYAHRIDQLTIIPRSSEAVKLINDLGYLVIIISNQSGIARGFYTDREVAIFNQALLGKIKEKGGRVDGIYYCPHHPEAKVDKYRVSCTCRKPEPGMLLQAAAEHDIDLEHSFLIGDKMSDIEAGKRAGCQEAILVLTGHGSDEVRTADTRILQVAEDLFEAVMKYIIKK